MPREVDEFIFVLPLNALELYKKKKMNCFKRIISKRFLSTDFSSPKIKVWLLDYVHGLVSKKGPVFEIFNVKQKKTC